MSIITGRMASCSYTKIFFPCSENGANVDPTDVIQGCVYPPVQTTPGNGLYVAGGLEFNGIVCSAGTLPDIAASESFVFLTVGACSGAAPVIALGDSVGTNSMRITKTTSNVVVQDSSNTDTLSTTIGAALVGHAVCLERGGNISYVVDGVEVASQATTVTGAIALSGDNKVMFGGLDYYGSALFVFSNGLPSDYLAALAWMSEKWQVGQKVIWPAWANL